MSKIIEPVQDYWCEYVSGVLTGIFLMMVFYPLIFIWVMGG